MNTACASFLMAAAIAAASGILQEREFLALFELSGEEGRLMHFFFTAALMLVFGIGAVLTRNQKA